MTATVDYQYVGGELELFSHAGHWKGYLRDQLRPYLRGDVLEVGAGIGGTTRALYPGNAASWTCLEPDSALLAELESSLDSLPAGAARLAAACGTLDDLPAEARFDAILYVDVLEHIEDDAAEVRRACGWLKPGGCLVVLAPAHQWLYSEFDRAIGHYRRYDRAMMRRLSPPGAALVRLRYLDSVGLWASLGNRLLLRSQMPTAGQIKFWDGVLVPCSRPLDPLCGFRVGKSLLAVWQA
jgi:SAM-dependent methyltransferase